jgi:hypothetical protein
MSSPAGVAQSCFGSDMRTEKSPYGGSACPYSANSGIRTRHLFSASYAFDKSNAYDGRMGYLTNTEATVGKNTSAFCHFERREKSFLGGRNPLPGRVRRQTEVSTYNLGGENSRGSCHAGTHDSTKNSNPPFIFRVVRI